MKNIVRFVFAACGICLSAAFARAELKPFPEMPVRQALWLSPETFASGEKGDSVEVWKDRSGCKNDAMQISPSLQPRLVEGPNGYWAVGFDKPGVLLRIPALRLGYETSVFMVSLDTAQAPQRSIHYGVLSADNNPYRKKADGYGFSYYKGAFDGYTVILSDGNNWQHLRDWAGKTARGTFEIVSFVKKGAQASLFRNGYCVAERALDRAKNARYHTGYQLGGEPGRAYIGAVAEVIVFDGALSQEDRRQIESYLGKKYGIPIAKTPKIGSNDPRFFDNGTFMYGNGYADQPYVVQIDKSHWLSVTTAANAEENDKDRRLVFLESFDAGKTWRQINTAIEPEAEMRQPSWGTLLRTPYGRIYCFYNLEPARRGERMQHVYRYSDDNGHSWSDRCVLPMRETQIDRAFKNTRSWGIDQPLVLNGKVYIAFTKFGGPNRHGEGFLFVSDNILTERDPEKIAWEMLPEGDKGIRGDQLGFLQEEHNIEPLSGVENGLYCAFRTLEGYVGESYSYDGGRSWSTPQFATYADGRFVKNPRACPMVWRTQSGKYLMWFHNHDGRRSAPARNKDRNPAWMSGGVFKDGRMVWSEPEPVLFGKVFKHNAGMSYPDLVEQDGRYYLTATNKERARLFELPKEMVEALWGQLLTDSESTVRLGENPGESVSLDEESLSILFDVVSNTASKKILYDGFDRNGKGIRVSANENGSLAVEVADDSSALPFVWNTDAPKSGSTVGRYALIFDGPADLLYVVKDGALQDGGGERDFGWGRFSHEMGNVVLKPPRLGEGVCLKGILPYRLSVSQAVALTKNNAASENK